MMSSRAWYQANKESIRAKSRLYYSEHRGQCQATHKRYYEEHKEAVLTQQKLWRQEHKEQVKIRKIQYYQENKEKIDITKAQQRLQLRARILTYYGDGKCACVKCGESRLACLSIDHKNGNGGQHRRSIGIPAGTRFYYWLIRQGLPKDYQTLCMNCQWAKKE